MRAQAAWFRLLIAVSLVLNGVGTAFASVQMLPGGGGHAGHAADTAMPPCHEGQAPETSTGHADTAADANGRQAPNSHADCCQPGACSCPCASHASAALVGIAPATACIAHAASVRPMALGHPSPALPHLIRPPIG